MGMGVRAQRVAKGERPLSDTQRIQILEGQVAHLTETVSLLVQAVDDEPDDDGLEEGERPEGQLLDPSDADTYGLEVPVDDEGKLICTCTMDEKCPLHES